MAALQTNSCCNKPCPGGSAWQRMGTAAAAGKGEALGKGLRVRVNNKPLLYKSCLAAPRPCQAAGAVGSPASVHGGGGRWGAHAGLSLARERAPPHATLQLSRGKVALAAHARAPLIANRSACLYSGNSVAYDEWSAINERSCVCCLAWAD